MPVVPGEPLPRLPGLDASPPQERKARRGSLGSTRELLKPRRVQRIDVSKPGTRTIGRQCRLFCIGH